MGTIKGKTTIAGLWLARDLDGELRLHRGRPARNLSLEMWESGEESTPIDPRLHPELSWTTGPMPVAVVPLGAPVGLTADEIDAEHDHRENGWTIRLTNEMKKPLCEVV